MCSTTMAIDPYLHPGIVGDAVVKHISLSHKHNLGRIEQLHERVHRQLVLHDLACCVARNVREGCYTVKARLNVYKCEL